MSRKGKCLDNYIMESFFGTQLKCSMIMNQSLKRLEN